MSKDDLMRESINELETADISKEELKRFLWNDKLLSIDIKQSKEPEKSENKKRDEDDNS